MGHVQPWLAASKNVTRFGGGLQNVLLEPAPDGESSRAVATDGWILVCADHFLPFAVPGRRLVDAAAFKAVMTANRAGTVTLDGPALTAPGKGTATVRAELQLEDDAGTFPQWETLLDGLTPTAGLPLLDPYIYARLAKALGLDTEAGGTRMNQSQTFELIGHGPNKLIKMVAGAAWGLIEPRPAPTSLA